VRITLAVAMHVFQANTSGPNGGAGGGTRGFRSELPRVAPLGAVESVLAWVIGHVVMVCRCRLALRPLQLLSRVDSAHPQLPSLCHVHSSEPNNEPGVCASVRASVMKVALQEERPEKILLLPKRDTLAECCMRNEGKGAQTAQRDDMNEVAHWGQRDDMNEVAHWGH
jgi:hypothetical protein